MGKPQDEIVTKEELDEMEHTLREKIRRHDYTPDDLDEYFAASKPYMDRLATKEDFRAGFDKIDLRMKKLLDIASRWGESTSTTDPADQQHAEASPPEG